MGALDDLLGSTPPDIKSDTPLYEAIGRFVTSFANAETAAHLVARRLSGLSDDKARVIFSGMRLGDLTDTIKALAKLDPEFDARIFEDIEACLSQLGLIAKRRHSLVHRASSFIDGKFLVTNALTSRSAKVTENEVFELNELSEMQSDCIQILLRLHKIASGAHQQSPIVSSSLYRNVHRPWRYKFQPPKTPGLKPRATHDKQKRPPDASGE